MIEYTESFKVRVTQEHIDNGKRCCLDTCPVSHALLDATGRPWSVYQWEADLVSDLENWTINWPSKIVEKIEAYDNGFGMEPFEFVAITSNWYELF